MSHGYLHLLQRHPLSHPLDTLVTHTPLTPTHLEIPPNILHKHLKMYPQILVSRPTRPRSTDTHGPLHGAHYPLTHTRTVRRAPGPVHTLRQPPLGGTGRTTHADGRARRDAPPAEASTTTSQKRPAPVRRGRRGHTHGHLGLTVISGRRLATVSKTKVSPSKRSFKTARTRRNSLWSWGGWTRKPAKEIGGGSSSPLAGSAGSQLGIDMSPGPRGPASEPDTLGPGPQWPRRGTGRAGVLLFKPRVIRTSICISGQQ